MKGPGAADPVQLVVARENWGDVPDWIAALAAECARTSQAKVAARLGYSGAVVSQALRGKYPGDMVALEDRVRGALMNATVSCPALGVLALDRCRDWREKARVFVNINAQRVRMYRACNRCPVNRKDDA